MTHQKKKNLFLQDFIQKEELLSLPIEFLYRILSLFYQNQQNKNEIKSYVTTFLFNCLDKYGKPASVLFNVVDFEDQRFEVVNRLLENYSNKFDFNMINQTLIKTVKDLTSEITKQKEEYSMMFKQMQEFYKEQLTELKETKKQIQETFKEQLTELKKMKKQEEEKQKQNEIDSLKRIENFSSDVDEIKKGFNDKIKSTQDQFQQICKKQEEFMDNAAIKKYHQMILETITFGQFRKFDDKLRDHFISELIKNVNNLHIKLILDNISTKDSIQIIQLFKGDIKDQIKIKITNDKIENLYEKDQLISCITKCLNITNDLIAEIEYPCNKFEQIMKIISDIKTQNDQKMKVSITIKDKNYFEQKYEWNKIINLLNVGKSINVIPEKAFYEFNNLSNLELSPDTITIGTSSFQNCSSLTQIKIPEKVTTIGDNSFKNCSSLTEMTIPTSVKSIGENCFENCLKLEQISINPFYTQIQFNTFSKCPLLKHFTISTERETKLKTSEYILISYTITDILYQTNFLDSSELSSYIDECSEIIFEIQYPSSNFTNIYQKIIDIKQNNSSKIKIGIFYTKMEITDNYFYNNKNINYLRLDSSITKTPNDGDGSSNGSFQNCSSLIEVFIPSSLCRIGNNTFSYCKSLKKINFELPSSLTSIGNGVFQSCESLSQISIPSSVTSIGNYTFYECKSLKQIPIPSSVTSIGSDSFMICESLTQITIPSSVTSIGDVAFNNCKSLTKVSFSNPSSLTSIERESFAICKLLTQITIPSSVTYIGKMAFRLCSSLAQVSFSNPSSLTSIGINAFDSCSSLTQITIPSSVTSIGENAFIVCSSLSQIIFSSPSSLTFIEDYAFCSCSSLTQITIPSSVTSIGKGAFCECSLLSQITFSTPSSLTSIREEAFRGCTSLTQIFFPSSLTSIGDSPFY